MSAGYGNRLAVSGRPQGVAPTKTGLTTHCRGRPLCRPSGYLFQCGVQVGQYVFRVVIPSGDEGYRRIVSYDETWKLIGIHRSPDVKSILHLLFCFG